MVGFSSYGAVSITISSDSIPIINNVTKHVKI